MRAMILIGVTVKAYWTYTEPLSTVGNMSGNRCKSDCRSRGREFDPDPVSYFRGN